MIQDHINIACIAWCKLYQKPFKFSVYIFDAYFTDFTMKSALIQHFVPFARKAHAAKI